MMINFYIISSLPLLSLDAPLSFSSKDFFAICKQWLPESDFEELNELTLYPETKSQNKFIKEWVNWELNFRNTVAKFRADKFNVDFKKHIRNAKNIIEMDKLIEVAYKADNPKERERILDTYRWNWFEEKERLYYFKFEHLCIYRLRLMLCEKWQLRDSSIGKKNVDLLLENLYLKGSKLTK